jgi:hypothetical protein
MTATRTRKQSDTPDATPKETPAAKGTVAPAPTPTPEPNICRCGCGQRTVRASAKYVAGHDARHAGEVGRTMDEAKVAEVFPVADFPKLNAKALGVIATAKRKAADKAAKAAARKAADEAAKLAYDAALASK